MLSGIIFSLSDGNGPLCPTLCSADGPSTPFGSGLLIFADSVRVLCIVLGFLLVVMSPTAISRCVTTGQHARFASLGFAVMVSVLTEVEHLGDTPSYRLLFNFLILVTGLYGLLAFSKETPTHKAG